MVTSTTSLTSATSPVMLSFETTQSSTVTLHTSSGTLLEPAPGPDAQMMALQETFELLAASDAMVIVESDRTRAAEKAIFDKLYQDFQRISQENDALRAQTIQLTGQLNRLTTIHETVTDALNEQVRLAQQRVQTTQQALDAALLQHQENAVAAMRRQLEAVQTAQDAARAQTDTLESSHRAQMEALTGAHTSQIATLNQSHQSTISRLQDQLSEARANHQTAVGAIAQKEHDVQSLTANVENLTAELTHTQSQLQSLQNQSNNRNTSITSFSQRKPLR
jgi:chromosome segregation ATPase